MNNAKKIACQVLFNNKDKEYLEEDRKFQGCPSIAVTKAGRIYTAWFAGGTCEPHIDNYCVVEYSDNGIDWIKKLKIVR